MPAKHRYDIGIVVALPEELEYVVEVAPLVESFAHGGTYFHVLNFGRFTAIVSLVGEMGPLPALHATQRLLEYADVRLLVMLGTAGALDDDLLIGDVAVATEINEHQANSRADTAEDGYKFSYSGRHWPLE
jgi:nucleoside phosphorylase